MTTAPTHHPAPAPRPSPKRAFTLLELLLAIGILTILLGIVLPFTFSVREKERRTRCADNLRKLGYAFTQYAADSRGSDLPRVVYDKTNLPHSYTAFTGPDASDPFTPDSPVQPNDVTASLWLLIRGNYISSEYSPATAAFICPSSTDTPDPLLDRAGHPVGPRNRSNFRSPQNLSYSYASPFSDAPNYGLKTDFLSPSFALLADKNPGKAGPTQDVTGPSYDAPPLSLRVANSLNHHQAGQYVLHGDMHVEFHTTPYCGDGGDNIYTAQADSPIMTGQAPPARSPGYIGLNLGPAWPTDSYLTPIQAP